MPNISTELMDLFADNQRNGQAGKGILHVTAGMDPKMGGVSQAVRTMIAGLSKKGIRNEVVSIDGASSFPGDLFSIHATGPGKGPWCYSSRLLPWLVDNLDRFDTVIVHGLWLYHGYAALKAMTFLKNSLRGKNKGKASTTRLFIMPHGMLDPYFQKASGRKIKALRNQVYWRLIEGRIINKSDGLLFTCEEERLLASQPFRPYRPKLQKVVGLGVGRASGLYACYV